MLRGKVSGKWPVLDFQGRGSNRKADRGETGHLRIATPRDLRSHSMFHQTPIPTSSSPLFPFYPSATSSSYSSSSSSFPLPLCPLQSPPRFDSSQVEKDRRMEEALKSNFRSEPLAASGQQEYQGLLADDLAWGAVERGHLLLGEGFVEELLDLQGFAEPEKEAEEKPEAGAESMEAVDNSNSLSSSSSALAFEPLPPLDISLPMSPLPLMAHDVEELEWVSLIMDDSLSLPEFPPPCSGVAPPLPPLPPSKPQVESPSESLPAPTLSPSVCALSTEAVVPIKAKRSKRSRSAGAVWSLSGPPPLADSSSSTTTTTSSSSSCSSSSSSFESYLIYDPAAAAAGEYNVLVDHVPPPPLKKQKPKKRGRKPKPPQAASTAAGGGERRCSHCGVQKTPQWRAGPLGAKTLCNACGVRYKSGRLLPEYRPACSPTFISNVHSNSHRKVLEMRRKKEAEILAAAAPPVPSF